MSFLHELISWTSSTAAFSLPKLTSAYIAVDQSIKIGVATHRSPIREEGWNSKLKETESAAGKSIIDNV